MTVNWTVVHRVEGRGMFRRTGFLGTWAEAVSKTHQIVTEHPDWEVWYVLATDTRVLIPGDTMSKDRRVRIEPERDDKRARETYALIRQHGQFPCHEGDVNRIKALAKIDGFTVSQHVERDEYRRPSYTISIHDGRGNLIFPDARPLP